MLNVAGFFIPLRNPDIYVEPNTFFENDTTLDEAAFYRAVKRLPNESTEAYALKVTRAVNQGLAHYWSDEGTEGIDRYHLRIPPYENYLLWLYSYLIPEVYEKYEFCDYRKAVERGVGYCSEHAIVAAEILRQNGIQAEVLNLSNLHVVVRFQVDSQRNIWWVSDPDYGVVINHDLDYLEQNPQAIEQAYLSAGHTADRVRYLVTIYATMGKMLYDGAAGYCGYRDTIEKTSYTAIWLIPAALLLGGWSLRRRVKK